MKSKAWEYFLVIVFFFRSKECMPLTHNTPTTTTTTSATAAVQEFLVEGITGRKEKCSLFSMICSIIPFICT